MEFLVEFEITVPPGTAEIEVEARERAEAMAAEALVHRGTEGCSERPAARAPADARLPA